MRYRRRVEPPSEPMWSQAPEFVGMTPEELREVKYRIAREVARKYEYVGRHRA